MNKLFSSLFLGKWQWLESLLEGAEARTPIYYLCEIVCIVLTSGICFLLGREWYRYSKGSASKEDFISFYQLMFFTLLLPIPFFYVVYELGWRLFG